MAGLDTRKARQGGPKRPPRPDTSPLVGIYREWEQKTRYAFETLWRGQTQKISARLDGMKAVTDIFSAAEFWRDWQTSYVQLSLPMMDEAVSIGTAAGADILELTWALGVDADLYNVAAADWARKYAGQLAKNLTKTDKGMLRRYLAAWVESGDPFPKLLERVNSFLNNPARAKRIAVTEATRAYAEGNLIAWGQSEVVTGRIWYAARDELMCPICGKLDNKVALMNDNIWRHQRNPAMDFGPGPIAPPAHPNCVLPGNIVAVPELSAGAKSLYDGQCIEIRTASGRNLSVTQNHPILTARGWIAANLLNEGDQVISHSQIERIASSVNPHYNHVPAEIEQVFDTFKVAREMSTVRVPATAKDFHGDGRFVDSNVEIVGADSFLHRNDKSTITQPAGEDALNRYDALLLSLYHLGTFAFFGQRCFASASSGIGGSGHLFALLNRHPLYPKYVSLRDSTRRDASIKQAFAKRPTIDSSLAGKLLLRFARDVTLNQCVEIGDMNTGGHNRELVGLSGVARLYARLKQALAKTGFTNTSDIREFSNRFAGFVAFDQVIEIRDFNFSGHVYDLQSELGELYTVNGIVSSNCRCWLAPFVGELPG